MRKRSISYLIDAGFWLIVSLLPVLFYMIQPLAYELTSASDTLPTFAQTMATFGINNTNYLYVAIMDIFGDQGLMPFFSSDSVVVLFLSYFILIQLLHVFVDFVLFIPRLAHKWLEKLTHTEN